MTQPDEIRSEEDCGGAEVGELFARSANPMLIADDLRHYVDANRAACVFLGLALDELLSYTIDDLTPQGGAQRLEQLWSGLLRGEMQAGAAKMTMPDGSNVTVDYSITPNIQPGRHLVIMSPSVGLGERLSTSTTGRAGDATRTPPTGPDRSSPRRACGTTGAGSFTPSTGSGTRPTGSRPITSCPTASRAGSARPAVHVRPSQRAPSSR